MTSFFYYFISLVHEKQSYDTKLKDQGYFIHVFTFVEKKRKCF